MLSLDEFIARIKNCYFVKCNDVQERKKCIELLCELGFNGEVLDILEEYEYPEHLYVGVIDGNYVDCFGGAESDASGTLIIQFSDIVERSRLYNSLTSKKPDYNISDEEFINSLKLLLSA